MYGYIRLFFGIYVWILWNIFGFLLMKYLREKVRINIYVCVFLLVNFILYSKLV